MELCVLAKIVLLLSIIIMSFNVCIYGFSLFYVLLDIIFTVIVVLIANLYCEYWIAKGIVIFALINALIVILLCFSKDKINELLVR